MQTSGQVGKTWTVVDKLLEAQWRQVWEFNRGTQSHGEPPNFCGFYIHKFNQETSSYKISHRNVICSIRNVPNNIVITSYGNKWLLDSSWWSFNNVFKFKSPYSTPKTSIILYVNYTLIKFFFFLRVNIWGNASCVSSKGKEKGTILIYPRALCLS